MHLPPSQTVSIGLGASRSPDISDGTSESHSSMMLADTVKQYEHGASNHQFDKKIRPRVSPHSHSGRQIRRSSQANVPNISHRAKPSRVAGSLSIPQF